MRAFMLGIALVPLLGVLHSPASTATDPSIVGDFCAGTGSSPASARIVVHFLNQGGKIVAQHVFGNQNVFPKAMVPQAGMTTDPELHPVTVDGNSLSYTSGMGYRYTFTPRSPTEASVTQQKGTYYDRFTVECGPGN